MTEQEARNWLVHEFGRASFETLEMFVAKLLNEADRQSLISRSTFASVWSRHIVDSTQLARLAPPGGIWIDIGSGGGLPGIAVAIVRDAPMILVEPRRKRAEFLSELCAQLSLSNVTVLKTRIQSVGTSAAVISARAVAPLGDIFAWTASNVSRETRYLLPRGENAARDLAFTRGAWQGSFHVEPSLSDQAAGIVVASQVRPR